MVLPAKYTKEKEMTNENQKIEIRHFPEQRLTFAYKLEGQKVIVAYSRANPHDQWSRARGRLIAQNRLGCQKPGIRHRLVVSSGAPEKSPKEDQTTWDKFLLSIFQVDQTPDLGTGC
jgi:hypothetical protein